ncbi:Electron transfer flavoprotein subunit alpha [Paraburkholderia sediminicola]|uniref:Electron transfer flavoprotein subunit alpha n=1 Tax=Paraburkholderia sediminicola TaxID=458836 RepID=A0A6J5CYX8_9BURK|nr:electron transfer flavoprotein subunit alpha/FixB family protein [Paraburkholderia sediminicola]CAB3745599.1 Electron transfer flavoprotein subunit alpha [Paraburkholderia sediminicola]
MIRTLVYVEAANGSVQSVTHELINAARGLGAKGDVEVIACAISNNPASLIDDLTGADRVLTVKHDVLANYNPEGHAVALQAAIESSNPDLVLIPYTTAGLDLGSLVAAKTGRPVVGYCTAISVDDGQLAATSQLYRGKLVAKTKTALPAVVVVVPGSFDDSKRADANPEVTDIAAPGALNALRIDFVSISAPDASQVDLTAAERIVCVGRGIGAEDKVSVATDLATLLGAEIAGSRPVIDSGWLPKARQVGKSGQKVKPKLYIALGVSGAPEHIEGMKNADFVIAINSDEKAPIFEVADIGTTCDLFELVPALCAGLGGE